MSSVEKKKSRAKPFSIMGKASALPLTSRFACLQVLLKILSLYSKLSLSLLYFYSSVYSFARLATLRLNPDKAEGIFDTQRDSWMNTYYFG